MSQRGGQIGERDLGIGRSSGRHLLAIGNHVGQFFDRDIRPAADIQPYAMYVALQRGDIRRGDIADMNEIAVLAGGAVSYERTTIGRGATLRKSDPKLSTTGLRLAPALLRDDRLHL